MPQDSATKAVGAVFIKRVKKSAATHHGGAWKIAYSDFVTAMMAFFLLLWLLNSVTQEQLEGISNYFAPASPSATQSGAGGVLGGQTISPDGAQINARSIPSVTLALPPPKSGLGGEDNQSDQKDKAEESDPDKISEEALKKREEDQFEHAKEELRQALQSIPNAQQLSKSLLVDNTPEGLRIQNADPDAGVLTAGPVKIPAAAGQPALEAVVTISSDTRGAETRVRIFASSPVEQDEKGGTDARLMELAQRVERRLDALIGH